MHYVEGIGSNNLAAQYRRKFWLRHLWRKVEAVVGALTAVVWFLVVRLLVALVEIGIAVLILWAIIQFT
jgi:hypothetical protein